MGWVNCTIAPWQKESDCSCTTTQTLHDRGQPVVVQHLFLVRHCATGVEKGRLVGSTDVSIAGRCEEKTASIAARLPQDCLCYCSPMLRTRQTYELLVKHGLEQEAMFDRRVREIDFGHWELKNFQEISRGEPDMIEAWMEYHSFTFPGGESVAAFVGRVASWLDEIRSKNIKNVVLVAHGGVIRYMICLALQLPADQYLLFDVQPASLTTINLYSEGGVLTGFNL